MRSDINSGAPPPPPPEIQPLAVSADDIFAMGSDGLSACLQELLRQGMPSRRFAERAEDGSPRVPSLVSVWLIGQVGNAVGQSKLVKLSNVKNKKDLRSIAGVERLLRGALDELRPIRAAS